MTVKILASNDPNTLLSAIKQNPVVLIRLPNIKRNELNLLRTKIQKTRLYKICKLINYLTSQNVKGKTILFLGPLHVLPFINKSVNKKFKFHNLVAIKIKNLVNEDNFFSNEHMGLIIFSTRVGNVYNDVKVPFEFCKSCKNTVKDYGGKTHLLNGNGTRISDVWKHLSVDETEDFPRDILELVEELVVRDPSEKVVAFSLTKYVPSDKFDIKKSNTDIFEEIFPTVPKIRSKKGLHKTNILLNEDAISGLEKIPDNSVGLALVDPPYNLAIRYGKFNDNMEDSEYYRWAQQWIDQIYRVLKKNGMLFLVNIPRWSLELFPYLLKRMIFNGWIVWDAWSIPNGKLIPAHYPILCFSKTSSYKLNKIKLRKYDQKEIDTVFPLNYGYCIRSSCLSRRTPEMRNDRKYLSDLYTDIHRIRHNSFRYNHPTLMPQKLAKRIIYLFSEQGDVVLDCFNGVGTTTLVAQKLNRKYIGIEKNISYYKTSVERHRLLSIGKDPFERTRAKSTSINKGYRLVKYQKYEVPKKILQLEVRNVAEKLGHCPTKEELQKYSQYPLKYYYDNFRDWAEITVATRRTGLLTGLLPN